MSPKMTVDQIRESFLRFFEGKAHVRLPSDNLVPQNDPTLLFTGAGMNQFKAQFGGVGITHRRVTTCQKCLRTGDIERVGKTPRHHTFFEMLGFFSFGDYFKEQAIPWYWEFLTQEMRLPKERLWITVYETDDEAHAIWSRIVPQDRIVRLGEADNFWPANAPSQGPNGPCGPCTEVYVDRGLEKGCGKPCKPGCSCDRYTEVGNIVFTQYNRQDGGVLAPLPQKNIDFGMGLERLTSAVQDVDTNFDIDSFKMLVDALASLLGLSSPEGAALIRLRRMADHLRAVTFCLAEGVTPGPNAQGYVVRRLLRRALLDAHELGARGALLHQAVGTVAKMMSGGYPGLAGEQTRVAAAVKGEEESFLRTLKSGSVLLSRYREELEQGGKKNLDGAKAFDLYSTYGFPLELTRDLLAESGLKVDEKGYEEAAEKARKISSADTGMEATVFAAGPGHRARAKFPETRFTGYEAMTSHSKILMLFNMKGEEVKALDSGEQGLLVVDTTPFYAESGGQLGDTGLVTGPSLEARILDTQKESGIILHSVRVGKGRLEAAQAVEMRVDESARRATEAHHSATHLLHWALKEVLGPKVGQAGSQVGPTSLRFDFSHGSALTPAEIARVEDLVNAEVWKSAATRCDEMDLESAKKSGAVAMFGEKYAGKVRVLSIGPSRELCGGTHVHSTGEIGLMRILSQEAVGSGVRRITGVARGAALELSRRQEKVLAEAAAALKTPMDDVARRVAGLQEEFALARKDLAAKTQQLSASAGKDLESRMKSLGTWRVLSELLGEGADVLALSDALKGKADVLLLAAPDKGKIQVLVTCSDMAQKGGLKADALLKAIAVHVGGRGGGRAQMARGSGDNPGGFDVARAALEALIAAS